MVKPEFYLQLDFRRNSRRAGRKWLGIKAHFAEAHRPRPSVDLYFFDGGYCGVQPVNVAGENPIGG